jgi:adenylosuccinate lyase
MKEVKMTHDVYQSPLSTRYASHEMAHIFSDQYKYALWRKLWTSLAKAQQKLGLPITDEQIDQLQSHIEQIDFDAVAKHEKNTRHDVMAHLLAYADQCPKAKPILHLGATSCFLTDNAEIFQMREGLKLLKHKLLSVMHYLSRFAEKYKDLPCLSYTHFQPAQPTTIGKRACLWLQDFLFDLNDLEFRMDHLYFLGVKGATGTQASFATLFEGDAQKISHLEKMIAEEMGFSEIIPISGQTYSRKQDLQITNVITGLAVSSHKMATDLRLLAHLKEIEEPFQDSQIGSSAMPYKRNPILSERICSLARYAISLNDNTAYTASLQWLERTLDDSANKRLTIPESFLTADAILQLLVYVVPRLTVYPFRIAAHLREELPFLMTEDILMVGVKNGGDRQTLHDQLRLHSQAAAKVIKEEGASNDLLDRILKDPLFNISSSEMQLITNSDRFIGRAPEQVAHFLKHEVAPRIEKYSNFKIDHVDIEK